ncbi:MAG: hypothetical protein Q9207_006453 [Kuettlingeria erythrocarpa]
MPLELRQVTSPSEVPEIVQGWLENEFLPTPTLLAVNWGTDEESYKDGIKDLSAGSFQGVLAASRSGAKVLRGGPKELCCDAQRSIPTEAARFQRRRVANTLMMEWGTRKADELGLETWLEASALRSMLHDKHGFGFLHTVDPYHSVGLREDNDEWRHCEETSRYLRLAVMMRPVNGVWNHGRAGIASFPAQDLVRNIWLG